MEDSDDFKSTIPWDDPYWSKEDDFEPTENSDCATEINKSPLKENVKSNKSCVEKNETTQNKIEQITGNTTTFQKTENFVRHQNGGYKQNFNTFRDGFNSNDRGQYYNEFNNDRRYNNNNGMSKQRYSNNNGNYNRNHGNRNFNPNYQSQQRNKYFKHSYNNPSNYNESYQEETQDGMNMSPEDKICESVNMSKRPTVEIYNVHSVKGKWSSTLNDQDFKNMSSESKAKNNGKVKSERMSGSKSHHQNENLNEDRSKKNDLKNVPQKNRFKEEFSNDRQTDQNKVNHNDLKSDAKSNNNYKECTSGLHDYQRFQTRFKMTDYPQSAGQDNIMICDDSTIIVKDTREDSCNKDNSEKPVTYNRRNDNNHQSKDNNNYNRFKRSNNTDNRHKRNVNDTENFPKNRTRNVPENEYKNQKNNSICTESIDGLRDSHDPSEKFEQSNENDSRHVNSLDRKSHSNYRNFGHSKFRSNNPKNEDFTRYNNRDYENRSWDTKREFRKENQGIVSRKDNLNARDNARNNSWKHENDNYRRNGNERNDIWRDQNNVAGKSNSYTHRSGDVDNNQYNFDCENRFKKDFSPKGNWNDNATMFDRKVSDKTGAGGSYHSNNRDNHNALRYSDKRRN